MRAGGGSEIKAAWQRFAGSVGAVGDMDVGVVQERVAAPGFGGVEVLLEASGVGSLGEAGR